MENGKQENPTDNQGRSVWNFGFLLNLIHWKFHSDTDVLIEAIEPIKLTEINFSDLKILETVNETGNGYEIDFGVGNVNYQSKFKLNKIGKNNLELSSEDIATLREYRNSNYQKLLAVNNVFIKRKEGSIEFMETNAYADYIGITDLKNTSESINHFWHVTLKNMLDDVIYYVTKAEKIFENFKQKDDENPITSEAEILINLKEEINITIRNNLPITTPQPPSVRINAYNAYEIYFPETGVRRSSNRTVDDFSVLDGYVLDGLITKLGFDFLKEKISFYDTLYKALVFLGQDSSINASYNELNTSTKFDLFINQFKPILSKEELQGLNLQKLIIIILAKIKLFVEEQLYDALTILNNFSQVIEPGFETELSLIIQEFQNNKDYPLNDYQIELYSKIKSFAKLLEKVTKPDGTVVYKRKAIIKYPLFDRTVLIDLVQFLIEEMSLIDISESTELENEWILILYKLELEIQAAKDPNLDIASLMRKKILEIGTK